MTTATDGAARLSQDEDDQVSGWQGEPEFFYGDFSRCSPPGDPGQRPATPDTPARRSGVHWRWDSTYQDYVQQRGDQVLLYTEYQNPRGCSEPQVAPGHSSGAKDDIQRHSSAIPNFGDLSIDGDVGPTEDLDWSARQVAGPPNGVHPSMYSVPSMPPRTMPRPMARLGPSKPYEDALDPRFRIVDKPKRFFSVGRIFKMVWFEPRTQHSATTSPGLDWTAACPQFHEEKPCAKFRFFVVARRRLHHSLCLSITTFVGKGATKEGRGRSKDFAVLYPFTIEPPEPFPEEEISRRPIAVIIEESEQFLAPTARLDCARIYTVEDNVRVMKIGRVHPESLDDLEAYYSESVS